MRANQWAKEEKRMAVELWELADLNPIENCWIWMKKQLYSQSFTSITELKEAIKVLWFDRMADSEYLRSLVESMPRRMAEVIEKGGNMTKY